MADDAWLTTAQVATRLQVHPQTVLRWLRSGALPGRALGGKAGWRVRATDVARFMENQSPRHRTGGPG
jgi:excisionase family DNA binding protein